MSVTEIVQCFLFPKKKRKALDNFCDRQRIQKRKHCTISVIDKSYVTSLNYLGNYLKFFYTTKQNIESSGPFKAIDDRQLGHTLLRLVDRGEVA